MSLSLYTQDDKKNTFGFTGGWNYSAISTDGPYTTKARNGYYGGVLWERRLSSHFTFQSGFLFTQNGYEMVNNPDIDNVTLNYVTIPLTGKVVVGPLYALAGVTAGFRVGGRTSYHNGEEKKLTYDDVKWHDIGAQVGLGFNILNFGIETRYNWGLTDIVPTKDKVHNQYLEIGFHFHFL